MKSLALAHILLTGIFAVLLHYTIGNRASLVFSMSSGLVLFDLISTALLWFWLIGKKNLIALGVLLIVCKYLILGLGVYELVTKYGQPLMIFAGVSVLILSALAYLFWERSKQEFRKSEGSEVQIGL